MPSDPPFADLIGRLQEGDADTASLIFDRYVQRLVCLAGAHLPQLLTPKLDPEDVVQSVFRSFFTRQRDGRFILDNWDRLWNLLAVLTVRKCGPRVEHFRAARRDVRREAVRANVPPSVDLVANVVDPTPSPIEAILLAETLAAVLQGLGPAQRLIVQLRLEGYTIEEVSSRVQCTERTVYRLLEKVRAGLEPAVTADSTGH